MKKIYFKYPFMIFQKCNCSQQNHIKEMEVKETDNGFILSTDVTCSTCGKELKRCYEITEDVREMTDDINGFKIIPSIKNEVALVKLDTFKCKIARNKLFFYGNYSHLRFFDNVIEEDIIPVGFEEE